MRRADRLFQIVQILRRHRTPVTAEMLAEELEVSRRSVYRDVAALMAQRVPVRGAAGIGYILDEGFDLPPLMLTPEEAEAAALGAQWVVVHGDPDLARAARDLIAKIAAVTPPETRRLLDDPPTRTPPARNAAPVLIDVAPLRTAIRTGNKVRLTYRDEKGDESERTIWPVLIGYREETRVLVAWCELRDDFRSFRLDRAIAADVLEERAPVRPGVLRARWARRLESMTVAPAEPPRVASANP
jgi:predicted DNA-binding transcriptional regulator YafY